VFEPVNDEPEGSAQRALAGSDLPLPSAVGPIGVIHRTLCDPVHDNRKRGASDGFLDHAIFGGTTGFRRQKQVVQAMSSLRLFKCWLVMIDRALLQATAHAVA
jgi:hypothetical protein